MSRSARVMALVAVAVILNSTFALAASSAPPNKDKLPKTWQLDNELRGTGQSLGSLVARTSSIKNSVESARKSAQDVASMAKTIAKIDSKVSRIKRQLDSVVKIPQLRMLRPLASNLGKVREQIRTVRVKADKANREVVQPLIGRLKDVERKLQTAMAKFRQAASETTQARRKLAELSGFVESRNYKRAEVSTLESLVRPAHSTVRSAKQTISQIDRSLSGIDGEFKSLAGKLRDVTKAKGSLQKLDKDLSSADKAAGNLDKVLSKKISVKLFKKRISVSVRQVLESPGKVLDIALKPLQKMADKALKPVLGKLKIQVKVPREITALSAQFDNLKSAVASAGSSISKVENALKSEIPKKYMDQIGRITKVSTSQLSR